MASSEVGPFLTWFSNWGQVVYFFAQIVFWVFIAAAAVSVALSYRSYVAHKTGAAKAKAEKKAAKAAEAAAVAAAAVPASPAPAASGIEIDKFVE